MAHSKAKQRTRRRMFQYFLDNGIVYDDEVAFFLEDYLHLQYPRQAFCPNHLSPFQIISDLYFDRVRAMLIDASRASGKTLTFAVMNLLDGCFRPEAIDITNAAATRDQAVKCDRYFTSFHKDPLLASLLAKDPTQSLSEYKTGSTVEVVTGSIKGLNSRHPAKSRIDEIELVTYETLKEGLSMSQSKGCVPATDMFASTRKWGGGTMTRLLNEADTRGIAVRPYGVVGDTPIDGPRDLARYPQGIPIRELVGQERLVYTWSPEQGNFLLARAYHVRCTRRHAAV